MYKTLIFTLLSLFICGVNVAFPQKGTPVFEQKYREAEVLENNELYDVAKEYYFDALVLARNTKQHRNIQNKIRQKILSMDCYAQFYHLIDQANKLEAMQNFESSAKYFSDAIQYAIEENLKISNLDSLNNRLLVISQTHQLCEMLNLVNNHNKNGNFTEAKVLFSELTNKSSELHNSWKKYSFNDDFVRKFDSLRNFVDLNRNVSKKYRDFFSYDFAQADNIFLEMIDKTAFQNGETFESDIFFKFSIDTNGVENRHILCSHKDDSFVDSLVAALDIVEFRQPHSYGFSIPTEDVFFHHIISSQRDVLFIKKRDNLYCKDVEFEELFGEKLAERMNLAPNGKYLFTFHRNEIDGKHSLHTELTDAKGVKARKWAKSNVVTF